MIAKYLTSADSGWLPQKLHASSAAVAGESVMSRVVLRKKVSGKKVTEIKKQFLLGNKVSGKKVTILNFV